MAPPRRTVPPVVRSIRFEPSDIVALEAVRLMLGAPDGSSTIRRLIREAALMGSAPKALNDEDRAFLEAARLAWEPAPVKPGKR